ncbi:MAG: serine hydrolase [Moraxellaceae bacterium]|nr:serine hydrolase [Moraxellaceae bacterium]
MALLLVSVPLSMQPATAAAATQNSKATKAKSTSAKKKPQKVSRYGTTRNKPTPAQLRQEQERLLALSRLPHRVGPTEIVQATDLLQPLSLESRAAVVMNAETGEILYGKNLTRTMPIASITKLMTAMVVLDARLPLDEEITISQDDTDSLRHTSSRLAVGTTLTRGEAMLLALMSSENRAAAALARTYPGGTAAAVAAMNRKATEIGMTNSHFADGSGLNGQNTASPTDLVRLVRSANTYSEIRHFSTTAEHAVIAGKKVLQYRNTNALVANTDWDIAVSKTGFLNEAGKCLVMQAKVNSTPVVIVLMDSNGRYTRIGDANRVKKWLESEMAAHGITLDAASL